MLLLICLVFTFSVEGRIFFFIFPSARWKVFNAVWNVVLRFSPTLLLLFLEGGMVHQMEIFDSHFYYILFSVFILFFYFLFMFILYIACILNFEYFVFWIFLVFVHFQARSVGMEWFMRLLVQDSLFYQNRKIWFIYLMTLWVEKWNSPMSLYISVSFCFTES